MALLDVRGLTRHFDVRPGLLGRLFGAQAQVIKAVENVSFSIGEGEILGLAGESGCGKSTTCLLITKLLEPTAGEILFQGQPIADLSGTGTGRLSPPGSDDLSGSLRVAEPALHGF